MTKKPLFVLTILLVVAFGAMAADISGKWTAEQPGRNGGAPRVTTFTFKVDGSKLTGNISRPGRGGDPVVTEISDGKVDGNTVTFNMKCRWAAMTWLSPTRAPSTATPSILNRP
jgi:hypothetical protein